MRQTVPAQLAVPAASLASRLVPSLVSQSTCTPNGVGARHEYLHRAVRCRVDGRKSIDFRSLACTAMHPNVGSSYVRMS